MLGLECCAGVHVFEITNKQGNLINDTIIPESLDPVS